MNVWNKGLQIKNWRIQMEDEQEYSSEQAEQDADAFVAQAEASEYQIWGL